MQREQDLELRRLTNGESDMKHLPLTFLSLVFLAGLSCQVIPAFGDQDLTEIEEEVWALEETYVAALKNAEHDELLGFLHDDFLGWPDSQERPADKIEAARFLQNNFAQPGEWSFHIDRAGIRIHGDIVITHYVINMSDKNGDGIEKTQAIRITHTWIRDASQWRILGGMSNVQ